MVLGQARRFLEVIPFSGITSLHFLHYYSGKYGVGFYRYNEASYNPDAGIEYLGAGYYNIDTISFSSCNSYSCNFIFKSGDLAMEKRNILQDIYKYYSIDLEESNTKESLMKLLIGQIMSHAAMSPQEHTAFLVAALSSCHRRCRAGCRGYCWRDNSHGRRNDSWFTCVWGDGNNGGHRNHRPDSCSIGRKRMIAIVIEDDLYVTKNLNVLGKGNRRIKY